MCLLLESIKIKDGIVFLPHLHQARMDRAVYELFGLPGAPDLISSIRQKNVPTNGLYKCRVVYYRNILEIECRPYEKRNIRSLKIVTSNEISYKHKFVNRVRINELVEQKGVCDDIIIVSHDLITDASYANLVFWDGKHWITPDSPILNGVQRQNLLEQGLIREEKVTVPDLNRFSRAGLINAMMDLNEMPVVDIHSILV